MLELLVASSVSGLRVNILCLYCKKQHSLTGDIVLARHLRELRKVNLRLNEADDSSHASVDEVARLRGVRAWLRDDADVR